MSLASTKRGGFLPFRNMRFYEELALYWDYLPSAFSSGLEALYSMSVSERREEQEESSPSETEPRKPLFTARSKII